jgi:hypothetical protein
MLRALLYLKGVVGGGQEGNLTNDRGVGVVFSVGKKQKNKQTEFANTGRRKRQAAYSRFCGLFSFK